MSVSPIASRLREAPPARPRRRGGDHLPEDCPVIPLGTSDGTLWFLDVIGQVRAIPAQKLSKLTLHNLFSPMSRWLQQAAETHPGWGKRNKDGDVVDFSPDNVARDLNNACAEEGVFNPLGRVRGTGVHLGADNDLVAHYGDVISVRGATMRPGRHGDYVYPTATARPRPAQEPQDGAAAGELAALLERWNWDRPGLDVRLMLGWVCASFYAGALDWRPHGWVTGPAAAGKSTLFKMLGQILHEPAGCIRTGDASAAAVRTSLGHACLPVLFDDAEAGETPERIMRLVELLRAASTGGLILRGSSDHQVAQFSVRFMGLMNSILRPALKAQDLSRLMLLSVKPVPADAAPLVLKPSELALLGQRLFRRMMDAWPRFQGELPRWHAALKQAGMSDRAPEQFGILLAAADVALHDTPASGDEIADLAGLLALGTASDRAEQQYEWQRCLERLTSTNVPGLQGGAVNLGHLIATVALMRVDVTEEGQAIEASIDTRRKAERLLAQYGLRVIIEYPPPEAGDRALPLRLSATDPNAPPSTDGKGRAHGWLAVANGHASLNGMVFRGTHWAAASGTVGGWKAALETAPDAKRQGEMRFAGANSRCVLVPLEHVLDGGSRFGAMVD